MPSRPEMSGIRTVLRIPLYRDIVTARFISGLGNWFFVIGLGWVMLRRTSDPVVVGAVMVSFRAPILLLSPFTGRLIGRFGTRIVGSVSFSVAAFATAALVLESFVHREATWVILMWSALIGCALAVGSPASLYALGQSVPETVRHTAVAFGSVTFNVSRSLGPVLGGLLLALTNTRATLLLNALTFIPMAVVLARAPNAPVPPRNGELRAVRWIRRDAVAGPVFLVAAAISLLAAPLQAFGPVIAQNREDGSLAAAVFVSAIGMGGLLTGVALTFLDPSARRTRLVVAGAASAGIGLLLTSLDAGVAATLLGLVLVGIGVEIAFVEVQTVAQVTAPPDLRSAAVAFGFTLTVGGLIVGSMILGPAFADHMDTTMVGCGVLLLSVAGWSTWQLRDRARGRGRPDRAPRMPEGTP